MALVVLSIIYNMTINKAALPPLEHIRSVWLRALERISMLRRIVFQGKTIDELNLNDLLAPCLVIDVSAKVHERYSVSVADIEEFEEKHGLIKTGSFIIIQTGWERFWGEPEKYRNNLVFPCVSNAAAHFLLKRNIAGLGIDTLSPDRPEEDYPVHAALLGAGKYIVENIANSAKLPLLAVIAWRYLSILRVARKHL